ncbi:MAG: hypothetical protein M3Q07_02335 [Pseudobdellovibrionaceae bacterium]|nr:hypothetical protein [Pseudobdellovibrionaceae bacterium]
MKYMNHLRKLALLSSLALSFAVYADGTLPLPGISSGILKGTVVMEQPINPMGPEAAPSTLEVTISFLDEKASVAKIPGIANPCDPGPSFREGRGTVTFANKTFTFKGVCVPEGAISTELEGSVPRIAVATNGAELLLLSGNVAYTGSQMTSFSGKLIYEGELQGSGEFILRKARP